MRLYHGTTKEKVGRIVRHGFKDSIGNYGIWRATPSGLAPVVLKGVWFANSPLDENEGLPEKTAAYFVLEIPGGKIRRYEIIEEAKSYREWCIPAALVNGYFKARKILSLDDLEEASKRRTVRRRKGRASQSGG